MAHSEPQLITSTRQQIFAVLVASLVAFGTVPAMADPQDARESFARALRAQTAGQHAKAAKLAAGHENYVLYPYYVYNDLRRRLRQYPTRELVDFFDAHGDSYLGMRLRGAWLDVLADAERWPEFLEFYRPSKKTRLRCLELTARIKSGQSDGVLSEARNIWLSGQSLPDECDFAFGRLYASDHMDDAVLWQRIRLAMQEGNSSLAGFLGRRLTAHDYKAAHTLWMRAHTDPAGALRDRSLVDDDRTREIMVHAIRRLLRGKLENAEKAWEKISARLTFSAQQAGTVAASIAVAAARTDHARRIDLLDAVPDANVTATVERYRLREGIGATAWPQLARWTASGSAKGVYPLRRRYWRSRALLALGRNDEARPLLQALAAERDYYGFLAADVLGEEYRLNLAPVAASEAETAAFLSIPGVQRARELDLLDRRTQARREWKFELDRLDRRQIEIAARVAADWSWPDRAISALGQAGSYDDLKLRFPLLYVDLVTLNANRRGLPAARVMAIIRSESAFVANAHSGAGARGLMQLMPATARETARRIGLKLSRARDLEQPAKNIALGVAYLARMLKRYDGNFAMAAAAYNAGPHRVRQWQRDECIEADVWIDSIPFTETRRYVRRAFFYTAIYESRMEQNMTRISSVMPAIPAKGSRSDADCGI